jgi:hypothetical protein
MVNEHLHTTRSEFRVVMSIAISAHNHCSVRLYLQLFVGGLVYYLRVLYPMCSFVQSGVQHILQCGFIFFSSSFLPYVASSSGLSIFDWPFGIF